MPSQYASHILHVVPSLPVVANLFEQVLVFDAALQSLEQNPAITGMVLAEQVRLLEDYLSLRPEALETIAAHAAQGRLDVGAWYAHPLPLGTESRIRSLGLGFEALRILGIKPSTARLPDAAHPDYPQILLGFGLRAGLGGAARQMLRGGDGSELPVFPVFSPSDLNHSRDSCVEQAAGRHLLVQVDGLAVEALPRQDEWLFSSRGGFASAALHHPPTAPVEAHDSAPPAPPAAEKLLLERVEPACVWAAQRLPRPGYILQGFWRALLRGDPELPAKLNDFLALYPDLPDDITGALVGVEAQHFRLTVLKPRQDNGAGVILRGVNRAATAERVRLHLRADFARCEVVRLDEARTGGILPIFKGVVEFTAHPHRLLTLWLR